MKPIPLLSFTLLLISYSVFGWTLANTQINLFSYLFVIISIFLLDAILTFRLFNWKVINPWFKNDIFAFISAIVIAFLFVVLVRWINIFVHGLALASAEILAKLDAQIYGFKKWQSFWILLIISEGSFILGTAFYLLIKNYT
ncbi:hypothetical protein [Okeania sp.]|uniref:hypothetical protein n=1 Tax=Okeania sp. TaxID=3100323 RepID=UPI002B4B3BFB|nr:hypothetical protein [Okeania sp.]MEB3341978.1 hypothetical protein [Okeania sp.]